MTSATFDTLGYFEKLKAAGVPEAQAKAQIEVIREVVEDKLATKQDLRELETRLEIRLADLKNDLLRWVIGAIIGQGAFIVAVMALLLSR